jgi:two-component system chemotaxis response regulator CheB
VNAIKQAARIHVKQIAGRSKDCTSKENRKDGSSVTAMSKTTHQVLAIAASTGGTEALSTLIPSFPADMPGTVVVQHMPPGFTKNFAERLNGLSICEVREAQAGERVIPGTVLIAPGNFHITLRRSGAFYYVHLDQGPILHGVRPAADTLFESVAQVAGSNAIGVIMTGMGKDGAMGIKKMHDAGAFTIAQDRQSCVIFGMPAEAIQLGAIDQVCPLHDIARTIVHQFRKVAVA